MRIAILSDTHNEQIRLRSVVTGCRTENIHTLIHCGDLTNPDLIEEMDGFEVIFTFGNGDFSTDRIQQAVLSTHPNSYCGYSFQGPMDGIQIGVTHGHMPSLLDEMAESGRYQYVFSGHTHRRSDTLVHATRMINPGALGGAYREEHSYAILDLENGDLQFKNIA